MTLEYLQKTDREKSFIINGSEHSEVSDAKEGGGRGKGGGCEAGRILPGIYGVCAFMRG